MVTLNGSIANRYPVGSVTRDDGLLQYHLQYLAKLLRSALNLMIENQSTSSRHNLPTFTQPPPREPPPTNGLRTDRKSQTQSYSVSRIRFSSCRLETSKPRSRVDRGSHVHAHVQPGLRIHLGLQPVRMLVGTGARSLGLQAA